MRKAKVFRNIWVERDCAAPQRVPLPPPPLFALRDNLPSHATVARSELHRRTR